MQKVSTLVSKDIGNTLTNIRTWGGVMYNVLDNGLVGGGTIDDTAALQTLINAAIAAGRKAIFFPHGANGQYRVTALTDADQVVFFGDNASFVGGYTGTIIQMGEGGVTPEEFDALQAEVTAVQGDVTALQAETVTGVVNVKTGFGAVGDGVTDDTAAILAAIASIPAGEFATLYFPPGRYISDPFTLPKWVTLKGASVGLWGSVGMPSNNYPPIYGTDIPSNQTLFLVTNTTTAFITLNTGSTVEGVSFFYPNQVAPTAASPTVYPATIKGAYGAVDTTIRNIMLYNSYIGIDLDGCDRHRIEWVFGDTLLRGIKINRCHDSSSISHVHFHDFMYSYSSNIGAWKLANSIGIEIQRSDAQQLNNIFVWKRFIGIGFTFDSSGGLEGGSFGTASDMSFDSCIYSIQFYQTQNQAGWELSNCQFSGYGILVQTANLVKLGLTNCRFWAIGASRAVEISNTNSSSVVRMSNCQISNGYTAAPIKSVTGAVGSLYMSNVVFEDNTPAIAVIDLVSTMKEFSYVGGSVGNNSVTVPQIPKRIISDVMGYNPRKAVAAPAVPASGVAVTNTFNVRIIVVVSPALGVSINGTNLAGIDRGTFLLSPGDTIAVTYSSAPAWYWYGE